MAHIHELIDFTVSAFIVHNSKVLLIHHKQLNGWLPIGGHIELDEDPQQALFREIQEESGLLPQELTVLSSKSGVDTDRTKFLFTPNHLDIHTINTTHRHTGLVYFLKCSTDKVSLATKEHNDIRWFDKEELVDADFSIFPEIQFYASHAIDAVDTQAPKENAGVCIVVTNKKNQVLLGKRKNAYKVGFWGLPGGRIEGKESVEQTAQRELKEETDLSAKSFHLLAVIREFQQTQNFIHFAYWCNQFEGFERVCEPDKCLDWQWFNLESLPHPILTGHLTAINHLREKKEFLLLDLQE